MSIQIIKNQDDAKKIWEKVFIPKNIYSTWEYNIFFHNALTHDFYFLVEENIFIPLVQEKTSKKLILFPEKRYEHTIIGDTKNIEHILLSFKEEVYIDYLLLPELIESGFQRHDFLYFLSLSSIQNWEQYIEKFKSEKKSKIRTQIRKVVSQGFMVKEGEKRDLQKLFDFNIKNYGEESDFKKILFQESYLSIFDCPKFKSYILKIEKEGFTYGIAYLLGFQNELYYMNMGVDKKERDIGKLLFISCVDFAIEKGYTLFTLGCGDCGWKEHWEAEKTPVYKYIKIEE